MSPNNPPDTPDDNDLKALLNPSQAEIPASLDERIKRMAHDAIDESASSELTSDGIRSENAIDKPHRARPRTLIKSLLPIAAVVVLSIILLPLISQQPGNTISTDRSFGDDATVASAPATESEVSRIAASDDSSAAAPTVPPTASPTITQSRQSIEQLNETALSKRSAISVEQVTSQSGTAQDQSLPALRESPQLDRTAEPAYRADVNAWINAIQNMVLQGNTEQAVRELDLFKKRFSAVDLEHQLPESTAD